MKILSVDDQVENLYLLEAMLNGAGCGYEVVSAHNGVEALQKLEQEDFDMIISDILMPQMDGFELCHQVKRREKLRDIPFIFYTATYTEKKDEELGLRLGASRFIIKPMDPEAFLGILRDVIKEYQAGQLSPVSQPMDPEDVLLKAYNRRLVQKLDAKVQELERVTQQLKTALQEKELEVAERRRAEGEVRKLNAELEERVKARTAELAATNKELETFSSAVSHDLRAPLRAINGFSQILATSCGKQLDPQANQCLERLRGETQRMGRLIEALLQLSRARRAEPAYEQVNLSQLAREIETDLRREYPERQVECEIEADLVTRGDPVLLRSVLRNLLANAWKFTAKRPVAYIKFGKMEQGGRVAYYVSDNGAGFDMDEGARLFTPFERLHSAEDFPGTGIGLAIVQQIIRRHGGQVWAQGEKDKGATFYFTLGEAQ